MRELPDRLSDASMRELPDRLSDEAKRVYSTQIETDVDYSLEGSDFRATRREHPSKVRIDDIGRGEASFIMFDYPAEDEYLAAYAKFTPEQLRKLSTVFEMAADLAEQQTND